jgi:hypothetical protein
MKLALYKGHCFYVAFMDDLLIEIGLVFGVVTDGAAIDTSELTGSDSSLD